MDFSGFPRGAQYTPVPNPMFGPLLEAIDDAAELKCILRAMWLLHGKGQQKRGYLRFVTVEELQSDRVLLTGLKGLDVPPKDAILRGIRSGVGRGTMLSLVVKGDGAPEELLFLNDEAGRKAVETIEKTGIDSKQVARGDSIEEGPPPGPLPNIFRLYEENVAVLTPIVADQMKEAELSYPWPWIEDAFKIAVTRNVRNWRYIEATLRRWATEGKDDGEPGRHSEKAAGTEEFLEYLQRRGRLPGP